MPLAIPETPPCVLCLSAGDATAGSGLAADILTLASMGCHPLPVQTAALVRDTRGIDELWPAAPELIAMQARAVLEDVPVAAFKLGFCGSVENVAVIAEILADYPDVPLVVEPGLHAAALLGEAGEEIAAALADLILPQTTLLVADRHELLRLTGLAGDEAGELDDDEDAGEAGDGGAGSAEVDAGEVVGHHTGHRRRRPAARGELRAAGEARHGHTGRGRDAGQGGLPRRDRQRTPGGDGLPALSGGAQGGRRGRLR